MTIGHEPGDANVEAYLPPFPNGSSLPTEGNAEDGTEIDEDSYVSDVFAGADDVLSESKISTLRTSFAPWHHPVKQIVRDYQWADLAKKLMKEQRHGDRKRNLRYFTLPGADLLDVRVMAEALDEFGTQIEYFGFDSGYSDGSNDGDGDPVGTYLAAESALRQSGKISDGAEILKDRLEDIALSGSHAAERLRHKSVFDIINIDACNHLGYAPTGRSSSIFDALEKLLAHQLKSEDPWLLFITTRANVDHLGGPTAKLQAAIHKNIETHTDAFIAPLAKCIGGAPANIVSDMNLSWTNQGSDFLKLYCVGIGKYLLQYYHAQQNLPAKVELASAFAYKVSTDDPDMLSLAFRISPKGLVVQAGSAGGAAIIPTLELGHALGMISRAERLWDLDVAIAEDGDVRSAAVEGTENLLSSAHYDIAGWKKWLEEIPIRPMKLNN